VGRRGPAPRPSRLNELRGNPGKRKNRAEPQPTAAAPTCPDWLDGDAAKEWKRIVPELERLGLLSVVDIPAFAGYCVAYQRWREAEQAVRAMAAGPGGLALAIGQGLEGMARDRLRLMKTLAEQFGFTPASRTRVKSTPPEPEDPFAEFDGLKGIDGGKRKA
jgi:P27 family predicted phage terminase small subunit